MASEGLTVKSASRAPSSELSWDQRCARLVVRVVEVLQADNGAIFSNGPGAAAKLVATAYRHGSEWEVPPVSGAINDVFRTGRATLASLPPDLAERRDPHQAQGRYLVVPLELDDNVVGAIVVTGLDDAVTLSVADQRLGVLTEAIALAVERFRVLAALEGRGDEITALRRQLDAFALDFRSTYMAERARSQQLSEALAELERTYRATVGGLAMAVEAKDECTGGHLYRVSRYGMLVTELAAPEHTHDVQFEYGFLLHDVGKLMVPDEVLNKPGALTDEEWQVMRSHPESGRSILEGIEFLEGAREIVYSHHERWDGQGYPRGLKGMEIPLGARIFPLCDAFDAMTSDRPYRRALPLHKALDEICNGAGTQFWSEAVDAFMSVPRYKLEAIMHERRSAP